MHIGVIGGGVSGLAFSIEAQRFGLDVAVIDRGEPSPQLGEVLEATAKYPLQRLGVYEEFVREQTPLSGRRARWGTTIVRESSTIFSPHGADWLLDKSKFEQCLRDRAISTGVRYQVGHVITACRRSEKWFVKLRSGERNVFDFLVDATGRVMWLTRRLGLKPIVIDHLVAVSLYYRTRDSSPVFDIESAAEGWLYRAPLQKGRTLLMLLTDRDLIPRDIKKSARLTRLGSFSELVNGPVRAAHSAYVRSDVRLGWAAVGDAALARDPLSGQGIKAAIDSAILLAQTLKRLKQGEDGVAHAYSRVADSTIQNYIVDRVKAYSSEQRWDSFPFWQRRHNSQEV